MSRAEKTMAGRGTWWSLQRSMLLVACAVLGLLGNQGCAPAGSSGADSGADSSSGADPDAGPDSDSAADAGSSLGSVQTIVTLTFDDGLEEQFLAQPILAAHGMKATFFIISGRFGNPGSLTVDQVRALQAEGHEIGGHTVSHPHLTNLSRMRQRHEICDDRQALLQLGLRITSFAYPFNDMDATTEQVAQECGYRWARLSGGLWLLSEPDRPYAETVPPQEDMRVRGVNSITSDISLAELEQHVLEAEGHGGGWVIFIFHYLCDDCGKSYATSPSTFSAFVDWLGARRARGTVVKTIQQVMATAAPTSDAGTPVR